MTTFGGWTGKVLRVNLATGKISQEDTIAKYKDYIGGMGIGLKVMWDEVPRTVKSTDPENRIVFAAGPLTGTSAPSAGRMTITSRSPMFFEKDMPDVHLVTTSHMGGHWSSALKYAGWDAVIVEGKADSPCYIAIMDDKVEIRDARRMWGQGTWKSSVEMMQEVGSDSIPLAIGQAGENLVPCSIIVSAAKNKAGGHAAVMGSKNLKGICVKGTGSVNIAADKAKWKELINYMLPMLSVHNGVQPLRKQPWSEYGPGHFFWSGGPGYYWGAADPRVYVGVTDPHDTNSMGYRVNQFWQYYKDMCRYLVRNDSCTGCPIACFVLTKGEGVAQYGYPGMKSNTCLQGLMGTLWLPEIVGNVLTTSSNKFEAMTDQRLYEVNMVASWAMDDFGIWDNYMSLPSTFKYALDNGIVKAKLSEAEYKSIPWDQYEKSSPEFLVNLIRRIAFKDGELGTALGLGPGGMALRWGFYDDLTHKEQCKVFPRGSASRHYNGGQIGCLLYLAFNRDPVCQEYVQMGMQGGVPLEVAKAVGQKLFGGDFVDSLMHITPMNKTKAKFAAFAVQEKMLKDSLTLCGRVFAVKFSPLKERNYVGDLTLESQMYSAVTGDKKDFDELQFAGNRIATLLRAITMRDYNTKDMRAKHDTIPEYMFADQHDKKPFEPGHYYLDRADWELSKDMFYETMGWDKATGTPTRARLEALGMKDVADDLEARGLLL